MVLLRLIRYPGLELHAEPICDAVHVGVVGDNLADIENVPVGESPLPKEVDVPRGHIPRRYGQLLDVFEHRHALVGQTGRSPVLLDPGQQVVILEQPAQTAPVMRYSVVALVDAAHEQGDQFPLYLA